MPRTLITAFEPYGEWSENASWLVLVELTRELPPDHEITTRRYPVEFAAVAERLTADLADDYDYVIHMGQSPGRARLELEAIALNVGREENCAGRDEARKENAESGPATEPPPPPLFRLREDGPQAYRCGLPLENLAEAIRAAGIPAAVSFHAGTYLCNAALYWTHHAAERMALKTQTTLVHLPLDPTQVIGQKKDRPSQPATTSAQAIRILLAELAKGPIA